MEKDIRKVHYRTSIWRSLALSALCFAADLLAIPLILRNKSAVSRRRLATLRPAQVPAVDRIALGLDWRLRMRYQRISDQLLRGIIATMMGLLLLSRFRNNRLRLLVLYTEAHAITYTIYTFGPLGPAWNDKLRPVAYYHALPEVIRRPGNNKNALYSGHTGNAACAAFFLARVWLDSRPQRRSAEQLLYSTALLAPLLVGAFRVRALKHFPSDVAVAIAIGAACGVMVPAFHKD